MVSGQALYERSLVLSDEEVAAQLKSETAKAALAKALCHHAVASSSGWHWQTSTYGLNAHLVYLIAIMDSWYPYTRAGSVLLVPFVFCTTMFAGRACVVRCTPMQAVPR